MIKAILLGGALLGAPALPVTTVSTAAVPISTSTSQSVPVSALPWGKAFTDYLRLIHDPKTPQVEIERARKALESGLEASAATTPSTIR